MRMRRGSWVRLKIRERSGPQKAQIVDERPGVARGAVYLSRALGGMHWWNKRDLMLTTPLKTKL